VISPSRLNRQTANFSADFANDDFVAALNLGAIKKPRNRDGRISFRHSTLDGDNVSSIVGLVTEGNWHNLGQNCKFRWKLLEIKPKYKIIKSI